MSSNNNDGKPMPVFAVGSRAQREVQKALKNSKDPSATITNYRKSKSLHAQFAKAFGTKPRYEVGEEGSNDATKATASGSSDDKTKASGTGGRGYRVESNQSHQSEQQKEKHQREQKQSPKHDVPGVAVETIDTDSILQFLSHLGLTQYQVHKKVGDMLQKQLEDELRKTTSEEALLQLLQNVWPYATANIEFRSILWLVLKQLGRRTPLVFLRAVAERKKTTGHLKYPDIFQPLPPLLKRLVWETDWTDRVSAEAENDPKTSYKQYRNLIEPTLLYETLEPHIESYCTTPALVEASGKIFVHSTQERRIVTSHRRALITSSSVVRTAATAAAATTTSKFILGKSAPSDTGTAASNVAGGGETSTSPSDKYKQSAEAISHIRTMLSDTTGGSASYRPLLLHALMSILMSKHGSNKNDDLLLAGERHLACTLVADVLLSTSGPLPKEFTFIRRLARILDDAVTRGLFTDKDLLDVQAALNEILQSESAVDVGTEEAETEKTTKSKKDDGKNSSKKKKIQINISLIRQLNVIITNALTQMKEEDVNSIFLNTVTDAVAPGYSKVIKKPMSISQMEVKIDNDVYHDLDSWVTDVKLMFANCMKYNKGPQGAWFRGEAERQKKIFLDEILTQAKRNWAAEVSKRNPNNEDESAKRKQESKDAPLIEPFGPAQKIRKIEDTSDYQLSMVAVASMLLCDPFVVRILLDRVLRSLRVDVLKGETVPAAHIIIPPIMQLLTLALWSSKMCAVRGGRFFIPHAGLRLPKKVESMEDLVPYASLRRYMPVMVHLLLDADLEKRLVMGGEFHAVANLSIPRPQPTPMIVDNSENPSSQVAVALIEGTFINICLPGHSQDNSLASSFVKCSNVLLGLAGGDILDDSSFFRGLVPVILRHKRLKPSVRDVIIDTWKKWLELSPDDSNTRTGKKKKRNGTGSVKSSAHEYLIFLLSEWSTLGNQLMPRDLLLEVTTAVAKIVDGSEANPNNKIAALWGREDDVDFAPIKKQYERVLSLLPESHRTALEKELGIQVQNETKNDDMEVENIDRSYK